MTDPQTPVPSGPLKLSDSICAPQYAASLKCKQAEMQDCLDESNYDKSKCQDYFDAYKECKKQERQLRLDSNRKSKRFFKFLQKRDMENAEFFFSLLVGLWSETWSEKQKFSFKGARVPS